jgi:hypothetical protein
MGLSGPFLASPRFGNTVFLPHGPGHGAANPAKTVLAGAILVKPSVFAGRCSKSGSFLAICGFKITASA